MKTLLIVISVALGVGVVSGLALAGTAWWWLGAVWCAVLGACWLDTELRYAPFMREVGGDEHSI